MSAAANVITMPNRVAGSRRLIDQRLVAGAKKRTG